MPPVSHKPCLFLYLPMQHMKAAVGTEASTAERHTELAYEGGGRLRAPALRNTPFALELSKKNRMEMLKASYTG